MDVRVAGEEALPLLGDYALSRPAVRYRSTPNAYVWENLFVTPAGAQQRNSAAQNGSRAAQPQTPARSAPISYDPLSYAAFDHPYELYRELRERAPVYYNPRRDLWVLSRYEDVTACLSDHQRFVNSMGNDVDATHDTYGPGQLIALDPPHHGRVRDVLGPVVHSGADRRPGAARPAGEPRPAGDVAERRWRRRRDGLRAPARVRRLAAPARDAGLRGRVLPQADGRVDGAHGRAVRPARRRRGGQPRGRSAHRRDPAAAAHAGPQRRNRRGQPGPRCRPHRGARRRGAGRAGPPAVVGVDRRLGRAADELRRAARPVPRPAGPAPRRAVARRGVRGGGPPLREPDEERRTADRLGGDPPRRHDPGERAGPGADRVGEPGRARLPRPRHVRPVPHLHRGEHDPVLRRGDPLVHRRAARPPDGRRHRAGTGRRPRRHRDARRRRPAAVDQADGARLRHAARRVRLLAAAAAGAHAARHLSCTSRPSSAARPA